MLSLITIISVLASASARLLSLPCESFNMTKTTWRSHNPIHMSRRQKYVSTQFNFSMIVDARDGMVSKEITQNGTWEPANINVIAHFVKEGNNVLNLGSQVGLESLLMGKLIGPTGKLFIFQPYRVSHKIVTKNIYLNDLEDITTIYNTGASDTKKNHTYNVNFANTGASQIAISAAPSESQVSTKSYEIVNISLDRVDALLPSDVKIDFALIDVELMEVLAMIGMKEVIKRSKDRLVIMVEWKYARNFNKDEKKTIDLLDFFWENGYKAYTYTPPTTGKCQIGKFARLYGFSDIKLIDGPDIFFISSAIKVPM